MTTSNKKKSEQLGMSYGKACNRLRKLVMFRLMQQVGEDNCTRCGQKIKTVDEMSMEHCEPWLDSGEPAALFFDIDNVSFSHLRCNIQAARKPGQKYFTPEARAAARRGRNRSKEKKSPYSAARRRAQYLRTGS